GGLSGFFENFGDNLDELGSRMPSILDGIWVTVQLTVLGALCAMLIALVFGLLQTVKFAVLRVIARLFVECFRGTSLLVQLCGRFCVRPRRGWELRARSCGVLALALNYGACGAEVGRGSIGSVPTGECEAISALSLSPVRGMFRIIIPQAW